MMTVVMENDYVIRLTCLR